MSLNQSIIEVEKAIGELTQAGPEALGAEIAFTLAKKLLLGAVQEATAENTTRILKAIRLLREAGVELSQATPSRK